MHGAFAAVSRLSKTSREQPSRFGTIVLALWPTKPALNLAQRIGCTERAANYLINGQRKVTAAALFAVIAEIMRP